MRKTKIICTIGPASDNEQILRAMCKSGMNVARLNFSHGTHEYHKANIELFRKVRDELKVPAAIMLDTKGPEIRVGNFKNGAVELKNGDRFVFTTREVEGNENLQEGENIIKINVTAANGETVRIYKINTYISLDRVEVQEEDKIPAIVLIAVLGICIIVLGISIVVKNARK